MALVPESAIKIIDNQRVTIAASELQLDDVIEVSPGSRLPADGQLLDDTVSVDESALTGESLPVEKQKVTTSWQARSWLTAWCALKLFRNKVKMPLTAFYT